jgi:hypothetical protein
LYDIFYNQKKNREQKRKLYKDLTQLVKYQWLLPLQKKIL